MSPWSFALFLLAPALGFSWSAGYAREWTPLLLVFYYSLPVALYELGRGIRGFVRRPLALKTGQWEVKLLAFLVPYTPYWLAVGFLQVPFFVAYKAFLQGPGLAVPLVILVAWPLGLHLHPFIASLFTLGLFFLAEIGVRKLHR